MTLLSEIEAEALATAGRSSRGAEITAAPVLDRAWLEAQVRGLIEEDEEEIDPDESLIFYGLDSIGVMRLAAELQRHGLEVPFEALAAVPSVTNWWALIEAQSRAA